jgi:N-acetylglutamate synthase-like GNAT family acetyltransferase
MEHTMPAPNFTLRPATATDASKIRAIISAVKINPTSLSWQRFILATDPEGKVIGCGQVKPHADGSRELASIAVLQAWRGKGIARMIIEYLLAQNPGRIYLTCRSRLGPFYQKFGFRAIQEAEMPPYFRRISRMIAVFQKLSRRGDGLLVMRRN